MERSLSQNLAAYRRAFGNSADLVIRTFAVTGTPAATLVLEGMVDKKLVAEAVLQPILNAQLVQKEPEEKFSYLMNNALATVDQECLTENKKAM